MIACYILYSPILDKFYIGVTQDSVNSRVEKHNNATYGNHFTSKSKDWEVFLAIPCNTVSQSMKIEKHIKRMKSKKYICNLKTYPIIVERLKEKFGS